MALFGAKKRDFDTPLPSLVCLKRRGTRAKRNERTNILGPWKSHATMARERKITMDYSPKKSLDYAHAKVNRNLYLILFLIFVVIDAIFVFSLAFGNSGAEWNATWLAGGLILGWLLICFLPFILYYQIRMTKIARLGDLMVTSVVFGQVVDESFGRSIQMHFEIAFPYNGETLHKETANIFFTRSLFHEANFADYQNKTVTIGYSPKEDRVLVFPLLTINQ